MPAPVVASVASDAPPERVWAVLASIDRWPVFDLFMTGLDGGGSVAEGRRLLARVRWVRLVATLVVDVVVPERRLEVLVTGLPGYRQRVVHEVTAYGRGSRLVVTVTPRGLLAPLVRPLLAWATPRITSQIVRLA